MNEIAVTILVFCNSLGTIDGYSKKDIVDACEVAMWACLMQKKTTHYCKQSTKLEFIEIRDGQ